MMRSSETRIDTLVALRALAITTIVFNHAHQGAELALGYGGGMNFLLAVSGYNLARFGLHERAARQFQASCFRLITGILGPTLCAMAAISVVETIPWYHWLFVGNWVTWHHPVMLHIWYVEVIVQLLIGFMLLFTVPLVPRAFARYPYAASVCLCAAGLAMLGLSVSFWNPEELKGRLPQFLLWNFSLGMVIFFALEASTRAQRLARIPVILALTVAGAALNYGYERMNFWWLLAAVTLWIFVPRLRLPAVAGRAATIVSQAAFTVYLTHAMFLWAYRRAHLPGNAFLQFGFAFAGSVTFWIVAASIARAYRSSGGPPLRRALGWRGKIALS